MSRARLPLVVAGCLLGSSACDVARDVRDPVRTVTYACEVDDDCDVGTCLTDVGFCSRSSGALDALLFEVTPRASDPIYGGARYLRQLRLSDHEESDDAALELNVPARVSIAGQILAADDQQACLQPPSLAERTLPVTLTFTPRQRLLGLSVPSYELQPNLVEFAGAQEYVFGGALPPGQYDVYMRPDASQLSDACRAIPQIFRDQTIGSEEGASGNFELEQPATSSLRLTISWQETLEGWRLDMVHPVTGEIISNRVRLTAADVVDGAIVTTLDYSSAESDFIPDTGEELVRLTPPKGVVAGTVLLQRSGLELLSPGEGAIGEISQFGEPVDFQSWVWKEDELDSPVPATVQFAALDLDEVGDGVIASFSSRARVDERGEVHARLLPGDYRIRVTPPGVGVGALGLLAGFESSVTVWPAAGEPTSQAGHVISVPPAISLRGSVVTDEDDARPVSGVEVRASAGNPNRGPCLQPVGTPDPEETQCERRRAAVLREALAEDAFVPRTRGALSEGDGEFRIDGLDCGQCRPGSGARFDVTVRPRPESGLPWFARHSLDFYADGTVSTFRMPVPVAVPMRITYGGTPEGGDATGLPGALVRVFALVDDQARVVRDPTGLVPCVSLPSPDGSPCLQSLLQLAELRSGADGQLLLLLPPDVD